MYSIEKKDFGYKLTMGGFIGPEEMKKWVDESKALLAAAPSSFGMFVDMRTLKPLPLEAQPLMQEGQKLYKQKGMVRSVVVVDSAITKMQFVRIGKETGIYEWERYIDSSAVSNWEATGINWLKNAIDPDK